MTNLNPPNKTKIVATVGPASNNKETLRELVKAGVNVFRLNFSHGSHDIHAQVVQMIRDINKETGANTCILQDLQGPKIRTNEIENGEVEIKDGQKLVITTRDMVGNSNIISTTYKSLVDDVKAGDMILIDDGKIELRVESKNKDEVHTVVVHGGPLKSRKGINLPNTKVSAPSLTEKDIEDLEFGLSQDVDWIALSFVRKAADVIDLKERIAKSGKNIKVVSKIEKPEALDNIDEIIQVTDGLMVARGDLGVEIEAEDVPMVQKMLVSKCNMACKPVIIATQMLESMIENARPTRAETNDCANAVMDGADALMLSAETAAGKFPIASVKSMAKTIMSVEQQANIYDKFYDLDPESITFNNDSLIRSACRMSTSTKTKAIIGMTKSGYTALRLAAHRPNAHIYVFTDQRALLTQLSLVWGVQGFYYDGTSPIDETFNEIEAFLKAKNLLKKGDVYINTGSMPLHWHGRTNMIKITEVI